jgi:hypothetical protein
MKSLALEHLSSEDLDALEDILGQGAQANQWTQREAGAVKTLSNARTGGSESGIRDYSQVPTVKRRPGSLTSI